MNHGRALVRVLLYPLSRFAWEVFFIAYLCKNYDQISHGCSLLDKKNIMITTEDTGSTLTKYYDAFQNKDWNIFESALDDNFTYYTDDCIVMQKPDFVAFLKRNGWQGTGYQISDQRIFSGSDLSVAQYKIAFEGS